jgi:hypothetical protein
MTTAIGREEAESEPGKFGELTPLKLLAGSEVLLLVHFQFFEVRYSGNNSVNSVMWRART